MSGERRSWDDIAGLPRYYGLGRSRTVSWPEGAPPQEEVPHAGETVWQEFLSEPLRVVSGVPAYCYGGWCVAVELGGDAWFVKLSKLTRTPPEPEIKPCPLCGCEPRVVPGQYGVRVTCDGTVGENAHEVSMWGEDRLDAIEAWNRRHG